MRRWAGCTLLLLLALDVAVALNPFALLFCKATGKSCIATVPCPEEVTSMLDVDKHKLEAMKNQMILQMKEGLAGGDSPMLMLPTHLSQKPTGAETGSYLALDLGGTNFRVLKVVLKGKGKFDVHSSKHKVYLSP
jgi:hexokinase